MIPALVADLNYMDSLSYDGWSYQTVTFFEGNDGSLVFQVSMRGEDGIKYNPKTIQRLVVFFDGSEIRLSS